MDMDLQKFIASQGGHGSFLGELSFEHSLAVAKVKTSRVTLKAAFHFGDSCVAPDEMGRSRVKTPRFSASDLVCKPQAAVVPKNARGTFPHLVPDCPAPPALRPRWFTCCLSWALVTPCV